MSNARYVVGLLVVLAVVCTVAAGMVAGPLWATIVSTVGVLCVLGTSIYLVITSIQTVMQRQAGSLRQHERMQKQIEETRTLVSRLADDVQALRARDGLSAEMQRTLQDLSLMARSVTVPQAHFEQLLRTVSANTRRTEAALDDAVAQLGVEVRSGRDAVSGSEVRAYGSSLD